MPHNRQIDIYHEAPLAIFDRVQKVTAGDYALVHLLVNDKDYRQKFMEVAHSRTQKQWPRKLILDNSAYELGKAFDAQDFASWICTLWPDTYVVPDVIGEATDTVDAFSDWTRNYKVPGKKMGVVQGKTEDEVVNCFKKLKSLGADIIGIPFLIGRDWPEGGSSPWDLVGQRIHILHRIHAECEICPIHLLGVALPQEGLLATARDWWIQSVDTSNPVVHGLLRIEYNEYGLQEKSSRLLADMIRDKVNLAQETTILLNIEKFKQMWTINY